MLVESIGTTREISDFGSTILMPEAFKISLTIKQLVPNSSNIFEGAIGGNRVNVLSDINATEAGREFVDGINTFVGNTLFDNIIGNNSNTGTIEQNSGVSITPSGPLN
jgi:hypothetical protein